MGKVSRVGRYDRVFFCIYEAGDSATNFVVIMNLYQFGAASGLGCIRALDTNRLRGPRV